MSSLTRREYRGPFAEIIDWLETPWPGLRPGTGHPIRIEQFIEGGSYVLRAELPGIDPERDLSVTVARDVLTVKAERHEDSASKHHSEFRYGTFSRSVPLPAGADVEHIEASYGHGIVDIRMPFEPESAATAVRTIPVRQDQHIKPT
jgi:HSP20 family protein